MSETTTMTRAEPAGPRPQEQPRLADVIERALIKGDLRDLNVEQRIALVQAICRREGIDWLSRPFDFFTDKKSGKVTLYARADCTRQLAKRDGITLEVVSHQLLDDCYEVHVRATAPASGKGTHKRTDEDLGVVSIAGLKGEDKANALMKAITKAKRRTILSICGLGLLDETEAEEVAEPRPVEARTVAAPAQPAALPTKATEEQLARISTLKTHLGLAGQSWKDKLAPHGVASARDLTPAQADALVVGLAQVAAMAGMIGGDGLPNLPPPAGHDGTPSPVGGAAGQAGFRGAGA